MQVSWTILITVTVFTEPKVEKVIILEPTTATLTLSCLEILVNNTEKSEKIIRRGRKVSLKQSGYGAFFKSKLLTLHWQNQTSL